MPRILFIAGQIYLPASRNGSSIINANIIPELAKDFEIDLVILHNEDCSEENLMEVRESVATLTVVKKDNTNFLSKVLSAVKYTLMFKPYEMAIYESVEAQRAIKKKMAENTYSVLFCDLHFTAMNVALPVHCPTIISPHDSLAMLYLRLSNKTKNIFSKVVCWVRHIIMKRYEKRVFNMFDKVLFVSNVDADFCRKNGVSSLLEVIPNGTNLTTNIQSINDPYKLVFHGNLTYRPNYDAVVYLCTEIMPALRKVDSSYLLTIVGSGGDDLLEKYQSDFIQFKGFVDDLATELANHGVYVCPLRTGAGLKNKILEGMAVGLPIVGTSLAFDGIEVSNEQDVLFADTTSDFVSAINRLAADNVLRTRFAERGPDIVDEKYTWLNVCRQYANIIDRLCG